MDGGLPWRLSVLDEADLVALTCLKKAQNLAASLPKKSPERKRAAKIVTSIERTRASISMARFLLAPPIRGGPGSYAKFYTEEQMKAMGR
jgi:hypothetical protein